MAVRLFVVGAGVGEGIAPYSVVVLGALIRAPAAPQLAATDGVAHCADGSYDPDNVSSHRPLRPSCLLQRVSVWLARP